MLLHRDRAGHSVHEPNVVGRSNRSEGWQSTIRDGHLVGARAVRDDCVVRAVTMVGAKVFGVVRTDVVFPG